MSCSKNNNVIASTLAFGMSLVALCTAVAELGRVEEAFSSLGGGSAGNALKDSASHTVLHLSFSMILNLLGFMSICMSTFHCDSAMKWSMAHMATTSSALCFLRIAAFGTMLVELILSSEIVVGAAGVLFLDFVCNLGSTAQFHVQEVIWEIGNFTKTGQDPFDPYRTGSAREAKAADTKMFSIAKLMQHLELENFCGYSQNLGSSLIVFWVCSLVSLVSQALMAIALNGEKERVSVHEENDEVRNLGSDGVALLNQFQASAQSAFAGH
mmetsp:Transcript_4407/g.10225  ORF Transcript_4407/g.10225 Transcript_4407/m.10225 type:complete len:269 (+) Transcript_4407:90-896(+)